MPTCLPLWRWIAATKLAAQNLLAGNLFRRRLAVALVRQCRQELLAGRYAGAAKLAGEALDIWRALALARPEAYRDRIGAALISRSEALRLGGRVDEALATAADAVAVLREADGTRARYLPELTDALRIHVLALLRADRRGEARAVAEELIRRCRGRASPWRRAATVLAVALIVRAEIDATAGQHEAALADLREAVRLCWRVYLARPFRGVVPLMRAGAALATQLGVMGRFQDALDEVWVPLRVYPRLARKYPMAFQPEVARVESLAAQWYLEVGEHTRGLVYAQRSVERYRWIAPRQPHQPQHYAALARALRVLVDLLLALDRAEEAVVAQTELVSRERVLHARTSCARVARQRYDKSVHGADLAWALDRLSDLTWRLGRREEAVRHQRDARIVCMDLVAAGDRTLEPTLASVCMVLAYRQETIGRGGWWELERLLRQAADLWRQHPDEPAETRAIFAGCLGDLSSRLSERGKVDEALALALEAVEVCRMLAVAGSERFQPELAASLNNLANRLSDAHRPVEALPVIGEAVQILRSLPDQPRADLVRSLRVLAWMQDEAGERDAALSTIEESVALGRRVAGTAPADGDALMWSLVTYSGLLDNREDWPRAAPVAEEAVDLLQRDAGSATVPTLVACMGTAAIASAHLGRAEAAAGWLSRMRVVCEASDDPELVEVLEEAVAEVTAVNLEGSPPLWSEARERG